MAEPLVLLPGMMCDARLFAPQIAAFSATRAIHVAPLTAADDMARLADQVLADAPPRFALAGLSMGGIVAMAIMAAAPERVARLALLDTNPLADPPEKAPIREEQVKRVLAGELRAVMRDEMKPNYLADGPARRVVLDLCMDMAETLGPAAFAAQSRAIQTRPDQCATLQSVAAPTLVMCGAEDALCPPERHEFMQGLIPGAELAVIPGAGHLPVLEQPELSNKALNRWLTR